MPAGQFLSIIGPSGCGKSTLLRIVGGLLKPSQGHALVSEEAPGRAQKSREIGFVFQDPALLPWRTVATNIRLPLEIDGLRRRRDLPDPDDLLELMGLAGFRDYYPHQLSGGMQQRVALARALAFDPSLMLMDEPFGALDALTRLQVRTDLEALWLRRRPTVLFITHSVEEAVGLSDRILVMSPSPGEVVEEIRVDIPRPRPIVLGDVPEFAAYVDRIHRHFERLGVLHGLGPAAQSAH